MVINGEWIDAADALRALLIARHKRGQSGRATMAARLTIAAMRRGYDQQITPIAESIAAEVAGLGQTVTVIVPARPRIGPHHFDINQGPRQSAPKGARAWEPM